jgi:hypothetical protein
MNILTLSEHKTISFPHSHDDERITSLAQDKPTKTFPQNTTFSLSLNSLISNYNKNEQYNNKNKNNTTTTATATTTTSKPTSTHLSDHHVRVVLSEAQKGAAVPGVKGAGRLRPCSSLGQVLEVPAQRHQQNLQAVQGQRLGCGERQMRDVEREE